MKRVTGSRKSALAAKEAAFETAVPTLRVMRLQSPALNQSAQPVVMIPDTTHSSSSTGGSNLDATLAMANNDLSVIPPSCTASLPLLTSSLCLPDSHVKLGVYVGETFIAYLGVLNAVSAPPNISGSPASASAANMPMIRRLTVTAQLQTPSQRWQLPSQLDPGNLQGGVDVPAGSGIDTIVSHVIEEPGPHILRVEVGYSYVTASDRNNRLTASSPTAPSSPPSSSSPSSATMSTKTFRKFYRFQVSSPLQTQCRVVRMGDTTCLVSVTVAYHRTTPATKSGGEETTPGALCLHTVEFVAAPGLQAERVGNKTAPVRMHSQQQSDRNDEGDTDTKNTRPPLTAVDLWDKSGYLQPNGAVSYIFTVKAQAPEAILRGVAGGDLLGRVKLSWTKAMGESGSLSSDAIYCPMVQPNPTNSLNVLSAASSNGSTTANNNNLNKFSVIHRSGLSVDVAAAAATRSPTPAQAALVKSFGISVDPIDPPSKIPLMVATKMQFLVVNHTNQPMTLQFQWRRWSPPSSSKAPPLPRTNSNSHGTTTAMRTTTNTSVPGSPSSVVVTGNYLSVCGPTHMSLGQVAGQGGSTVVQVSFLALSPGLVQAVGCVVVDLVSGQEFPQPPLFYTFCQEEDEQEEG